MAVAKIHTEMLRMQSISSSPESRRRTESTVSTLSIASVDAAKMMTSTAELLPPLKDVRRFVKKNKLEEIAWVGRAGIASYLITRAGASMPKIQQVRN